MIADVKLLARLFGLPYFPVTPLFPLAGPVGMVPLPSKWHIQFGEPIATADYDESAAEDPMITFELTDQVRETIQQTLYQLLANRRNIRSSAERFRRELPLELCPAIIFAIAASRAAAICALTSSASCRMPASPSMVTMLVSTGLPSSSVTSPRISVTIAPCDSVTESR